MGTNGFNLLYIGRYVHSFVNSFPFYILGIMQLQGILGSLPNTAAENLFYVTPNTYKVNLGITYYKTGLIDTLFHHVLSVAKALESSKSKFVRIIQKK